MTTTTAGYIAALLQHMYRGDAEPTQQMLEQAGVFEDPMEARKPLAHMGALMLRWDSRVLKPARRTVWSRSG